MSIKAFDVIKLSGTPYQIGYKHGLAAQTLIANSIKNYKRMFFELLNLDWSEVKDMADSYVEAITKCDQDILEELQGVAEGSGFTLQEIVALNSRTEFLYSNINDNCEGCTAVAVKTKEKSIIGQNWDYKPMVKDSVLILKITQNNKPDIMMITEAGMIGKIGFNSQGLCTGLNALSAPKVAKGIPLHIALRLLLNSENLTQGKKLLEKHSIAGCGNIIYGSSEEVLSIEVGPDGYQVVLPEKRILVHTNHYLSSNYSVYNSSEDRRIVNSIIRYNRMKSILENITQAITFEDLKSAFCDHSDNKDSICRHPDLKKAEVDQVQTLFSVIFDLKKLRLHLAGGNPCETKYKIYSLD